MQDIFRGRQVKEQKATLMFITKAQDPSNKKAGNEKEDKGKYQLNTKTKDKPENHEEQNTGNTMALVTGRKQLGVTQQHRPKIQTKQTRG